MFGCLLCFPSGAIARRVSSAASRLPGTTSLRFALLGWQRLHEIWQAETKRSAEKAFDLFIQTYEAKYPKSTLCLRKDREELLAFYDYPAQHWQSIRTSNPIESTFATIRHRTKRTKGCLSRDGMLHMMFKLGQCAEGKWRKLRGFDSLGKVIKGVQFKDGLEVISDKQVAA